jgi:hypothetical protein
MIMAGVSMAPFLLPGDALLVDEVDSVSDLALGDVVVMKHEGTCERIVHRVVGLNPLRTKGDRNSIWDPLDEAWRLGGVVTRRNRKGIWVSVFRGRIAYWLCRWGMYPGQKIPIWLSRSRLLKSKNQSA